MNNARFWKMLVMGSATLVMIVGPGLVKYINEYERQQNNRENQEMLVRELYNRTIEGPFKNDLASLRIPSGQFSLKNIGITSFFYGIIACS